MEILTVRFASADAFLAAYDATLPHGGLFVPSTRLFVPQTPVVIEFVGRALPEHVFLNAGVVSTRPAIPRLAVHAAVQVAFPPEEHGAVSYVLGLVRGEIPLRRRRRAPRLPVSVPATYRRGDDLHSREAVVVDISIGGLSLRGTGPLPVDTPLVIDLPLPGGVAPLELAGKVVFADEAANRVGVKLDKGRGGGVPRVREAIRRLRAA